MQNPTNTQPIPSTKDCILCQKSITVADYTDHIKKCELNFQEVPCKYCNTLIIGAFMSDHLEDCILYIEHRFELMKSTYFQNETECCICCLEMSKEEDRCNLCCGHQYHSWCIQEWFLRRQECPICRQTIH